MTSEPVFRSSEIRRSMDVFTSDGEHLGTVLHITTGSEGAPGGELLPSVEQQSEIDGESLGPAPTQSAGNFGPITQSARNSYATGGSYGRALGGAALLIGNFHGLTSRRTIPVDDVQTVAMERVVLRYPKSYYQ